jgi:hypothetical protein
MKKFILKRQMLYTERAEIEAESFDEAKKILNSDDDRFQSENDNVMYDANIEFIGDID